MPEERKGAMYLGIAAIVAGLGLALIKKKPPAPPEKGVTIALKNPPAEGNYWQVLIANASKSDSRFIQKIPMDEIVVLDDIADWDFPLSVDLIVYQWIEPDVSARGIYRIQSYWGEDTKDYAPIFIPSFGSYYFNFATEQFE